MRAAVLIFVIACACGGCGGSAGTAGAAAPSSKAARANDLHRALDAEECAAMFDFLAQKRWLPDPDATSEVVVKSCLESKTTKAYYDCIMGSDSREESERCQ